MGETNKTRERSMKWIRRNKWFLNLVFNLVLFPIIVWVTYEVGFNHGMVKESYDNRHYYNEQEVSGLLSQYHTDTLRLNVLLRDCEGR